MAVSEISLIEGLSPDSPEKIESRLNSALSTAKIPGFLPAYEFGLEVYQMSLRSADPFQLFKTEFSQGHKPIPINGLIWMGTRREMFERIKEKIGQGYRCIKLKVGAIDFQEELALLRYLRKNFSVEELELRLDANGAFPYVSALDKLFVLADYQIHSIEQPIRPGQREEITKLCELSPIPIALDEELIGIEDVYSKKQLAEEIRPQYLILKPSLLGGFRHCDEWIEIARGLGIGWWATSALESNIGLNAIAQWVSSKENPLPQGLGTGQIFNNNFQSPLVVKDACLHYSQETLWESFQDFL